VRLFTATFIKRTGLAFAVLAAVWLVIVAWQVLEHNRVKKAARTALLNRSQDITTTLGLVIRSQRRFGGIVSQERLEPALTELVTRRGTILFVGVVPKARGRGLGLALTLKGIQTIAPRAPTALLDSTDVQNRPMRKILEKLGYRLTAVQHYFKWHTTGP